MDTQILTLFGDEDFQAPPPTKKPGKNEQPEEKIAEEKTEEEKPVPAPAVAAKTNSSLSYDAPSVSDKKREFVIGNSYVEPVTTDDTEITETTNTSEIVEESKEEVAHEEIADIADDEEHLVDEAENPQPASNTLPTDIVAKEHDEETTQVEDANALDTEMRIALLQNDYASYFHSEKPASPTTAGNKSSIVFEGVVTPKKNIEPVAAKEEVQPVKEDMEEEVIAVVDPLPEFELESRYYSIGEVAKLFQVNNSHIRFWTNEFKLKPRTTRKGDRLYNAEDIATLRLIHHLVKEKGHTIKGAKEKMKQKETVEVNLDLSESLLKLKEMLTEMKNQL